LKILEIGLNILEIALTNPKKSDKFRNRSDNVRNSFDNARNKSDKCRNSSESLTQTQIKKPAQSSKNIRRKKYKEGLGALGKDGLKRITST
jgi:hypothetical protein